MLVSSSGSTRPGLPAGISPELPGDLGSPPEIDLEQLARAAKRAFDALPDAATFPALFVHEGVTYRLRSTTFRIIVEDRRGRPLCCVWGG